jgi:hypothetical protein
VPGDHLMQAIRLAENRHPLIRDPFYRASQTICMIGLFRRSKETQATA